MDFPRPGSMPWINQTDSQFQKIRLFFPTAIKIFQRIRQSCELLLDKKELIKTLNDSNFDVIVIHCLDFCTFGLTRVLKIDAYVWMSTGILLEEMAWYSGSPLALSYVPSLSPPSQPGPLSLWDRLKNTLVSGLVFGLFQYGVVHTYTEIFRNRFGHDFPHYDEILRKTQLYFANVDPTFEYARPVSRNVISVGGLTMEKPEKLSEVRFKSLIF